ncbi:N-acetylmuramoyl-L-alanine amidase family protein [Priestia taiwanensis]|uniref:N-acetylmuramoyl-L-alanine amidase n=1 Tax=Priestia taiwanensis TaxID=1347902 RepID=A0A917AIK8_9BACI|nr:N-acetylmuramoyl-L-alanine amidase [Priestia taiwanensis]MBM7361660.1 N-acetylmuramoyl-L-alanine amidase [Priestia taiwanensis]GGE55937.1 N-acetylmuramoyl-L-alanine amidase [Priestia taiwanensis]
MVYPIERNYINMGNARNGRKLVGVKFIVSHDTGNPGSTAIGNRNYFNDNQPKSSAHTFVDDQEIMEIIPLDEMAYHVQAQKPADNELFGANANSAAIGVELCYGGSIQFRQAYDRYVWYHAYLCRTYRLDPRTKIVSHRTLDEGRKIDPEGVFKANGIKWERFIKDVYRQYVSRQ